MSFNFFAPELYQINDVIHDDNMAIAFKKVKKYCDKHSCKQEDHDGPISLHTTKQYRLTMKINTK